LAVVLTGTDLYRDIATDPAAQQSLVLAQRLVVLQELGPQALPIDMRDKTRVIFQSTSSRQTLTKTGQHLRAVMVGHLRDEKSPQTLLQAARLLQNEPTILIDHIGAPLDPALGEQARATEAACPAYRWLGGLPRAVVRQRIQRAHVLVHASAMEGGAHVIMEAVCSGTPVIASRVPGNVGMLGAAYAGYFEHGDAAGLAALLRRCADPADPLLERLRSQCGLRAGLFAPAQEQSLLLKLIQELQESP
jgi:putative glycosyltransferase (TIGR04348 family)